jgi:hypothetical protein
MPQEIRLNEARRGRWLDFSSITVIFDWVVVIMPSTF